MREAGARIIARVTELILRTVVIQFDGRVVEVFGRPGGVGNRQHVAVMKERAATCNQMWRVQAISRRRPSSAASRSAMSRLRSAHRPDARSLRRLCTARCSACGPTLAQADIPRRT